MRSRQGAMKVAGAIARFYHFEPVATESASLQRSDDAASQAQWKTR